jgi:hypothetical protein
VYRDHLDTLSLLSGAARCWFILRYRRSTSEGGTMSMHLGLGTQFTAGIIWLASVQIASTQVITVRPSWWANDFKTTSSSTHIFSSDLSRYVERSIEPVVQRTPPASNQRRGRVTKIVLGLGMIGAGAYLFSSSRGWIHEEYTYGPSYPQNPSNFEVERRCRESKPVPSPPPTDPRVMPIPLPPDERCQLWPKSSIAFGLVAAGGGVIATAFR